ncbi:MAG: response regulator [Pseudomonadota bacterium]
MSESDERWHILVVEDSATQAERLRLVLEESGFAVTVARDGAEALDRLKGFKPDLVVSDVMMPRMNGYQMCRAIKRDPALRDVPVLMLTTLQDPVEVLEGLESGADSYLTKPCDDSLLVHRINALLFAPEEADVDEEEAPPIEVMLPGGPRRIHSTRRRMLQVLLSTYENAVRQNQELAAARELLERLNESLVTEIGERRRAEADAQRLNARLERSNEELERFAYVACHDLEQPLNQIGMLTEVLGRSMEGRLDAHQSQAMELITTGVGRMRSLILDLLMLSRVDSQGKPLAPVELDGVLAVVRGTLIDDIANSGAALHVPPLPRVMGDEGQLIQLFQNLLGNALKFRRAAVPPEIRVEAVLQGERWRFSVRDNSIGFDPSKATEVFQIFRRLHTQDEYPGTGIGLGICAKIVDRHGGKIWAESEPGVGSVFYFTLPVVADGRAPDTD